jgi:hypothetical protein
MAKSGDLTCRYAAIFLLVECRSFGERSGKGASNEPVSMAQYRIPSTVLPLVVGIPIQQTNFDPGAFQRLLKYAEI